MTHSHCFNKGLPKDKNIERVLLADWFHPDGQLNLPSWAKVFVYVSQAGVHPRDTN